MHGKSRRLSTLVKDINNEFHTIANLNVFITSPKRSVAHCTQEAIDIKSTVIVAVGGDGTFSEMVHTVVSLGKNSEIKLALFPNGSGNDFAKTVNAKSDLTLLKKSILEGKERSSDVLEITRDGSSESRYSVNIADVGIGGEVAKFLHGKRKWLGANLTYLFATLRGFLSYKRSFVSIKSTHFLWEGYILGVCMANGKFFGSGLGIAPMAKINDGKMQIVVLGGITLWDYFLQLSKVKKCQPLHHPHVHYFESDRISISTSAKLHLDVDGEYGGFGSLHAVVRPGILRLVVAD